MLMKEKIAQMVMDAVADLDITVSNQSKAKITVTYPDARLGDYSSNAALILAKDAKKSPIDLANDIIGKLDKAQLEKVEAVSPGFINFRLKPTELISTNDSKPSKKSKDKILLEYFQPNIAKPLHIGHLRTAIIGDAIKRMMLFLGLNAESDTHMGDWGTQFGFLILASKNFKNMELNEAYVKLNAQAEKDPAILEQAKQEFVKLEKGDETNRKIWKQLVDESVKKFLSFAKEFELLPFDHHWPESFYEDKMPAVLEELKNKKLLVESQGAQIVNLEEQGLGVAIIIKSDGGTTYLLRDLAGFLFAKDQGYPQHLYVVDNRQALHYHQLFVILKLMGQYKEGEGAHINYGFISLKGAALSTRKGNMILAEDLISQAKEKVAKIIEQKNPDLKDRKHASDAVAKSALKYFDLKHNRHSDIEFEWDEVLDFEGDSGPYLQYAHARLASILRKVGSEGKFSDIEISDTEREILFKSSILAEVVSDSLKDYMPNILANYLYNFATLLNKFYHESPVIQEKDEKVKNFRLALIARAKDTLKTGLNLLGIEALDEM
ncbi:MAG TPA: arginine--tRNA ligase [Patescibacteria group bacterium]|jgi:arginyl-tRNA synthetase|nr:arginine--tRNA ligase [Patescibacteria group bacterium]